MALTSLLTSHSCGACQWDSIHESSCRQDHTISINEETSTNADSEPEGPSRPCWADLVDSDDEELHGQKNTGSVDKPRWADLESSDDEEEGRRLSKQGPETSHLVTSLCEHTMSLSHQNLDLHNSRLPQSSGGSSIDQQLSSSVPAARLAPGVSRGPSRCLLSGPQGKGSRQVEQQSQQKRTSATFVNGSRSDSAGLKNSTAKGMGKGIGKRRSLAGSSASKGLGNGAYAKLQCQFVIGIEQDAKFQVVKRILGQGGEHMKSIAQQTDAKLRLRGRGSKFLEGWENKESNDDLMLCISSQDRVGFEKAKELVTDLLKGIYQSYSSFCIKAEQTPPPLNIQLHDGYREGSR